MFGVPYVYTQSRILKVRNGTVSENEFVFVTTLYGIGCHEAKGS